MPSRTATSSNLPDSGPDAVPARRGFKWSLLLGFDIFVSYRRGPHASRYISNLKNALQSQGFTTFVDQEETEGGEELGKVIRKSLKRTRMLIVLAENRVVDSPWVRNEIGQFREKAGRKVVPINIGDFLAPDKPQPPPFDYLQSLSWLPESETDFRNGVPSPDVVEGIRKSFTRLRVTTLSRAITAVVMAILLVLLVIALIMRSQAVEQADIAEKRRLIAEDRRQTAQSRGLAVMSERLLKDAFDQSILLAVLAAQVKDTTSARRVLIQALEAHPRLLAMLHPEPGFAASSDGLAFSPDGTLIATSGIRYPAVLWDVQKRRSLSPPLLAKDMKDVRKLDFSPDGRLLAAANHRGLVRIWNVAKRQTVGPPLEHEANVASLAFSPDSGQLAVVSRGKVRIWDLRTFEETPESPLVDPESAIWSIAYSPDERIIGSGGGDGTVTIWNLGAGLAERRLKVSDSKIKFLQFAPDGRSFVAGYGDGIYGRWPVMAAAALVKPRALSIPPIAQLFGLSGIKDLRLSNLLLPDRVPITHELGENDWAIRGELLANIHEGSVLLWSASRESRSPIELSSQIDTARYPFPYAFRDGRKLIAAAPDGVTIAVAGGDGTISIRRGGDGDSGKSWTVDVDAVDAMAFDPDGTRLAIAGCVEEIVLDPRKYYRGVKPRCVRSRVEVWAIQAPKREYGPFEDHTAAILTLIFDDSGDILVSLGVDGSRVWRNLRTEQVKVEKFGEETFSFQLGAVGGHPPRAVAAEIGFGVRSPRVLLWDRPFDMSSAPRISRRRDPVSSLAVHPVDRSILIGGHGGWIERWRPSELETERSLLADYVFEKSAKYEISQLALSQNGKWLASNTENGAIVWDLSARQRLIEFNGGRSNDPIVFSQDDEALIFGKRRFGLELNLWTARACQRVNRNLTWAEWDLYMQDLEYRPVCDNVDLDPHELVAYVDSLVARGRPERAPDLLQRASELAADRGDETNDKICRTGGLLGEGARVVESCDRAVAGCLLKFQCAEYKDHRAVARAQAGNFDGAADDLRAWIERLEVQNAEANRDEIEIRKTWIRELAAGRNPFDTEALERLRFE